MSLPTNTPKPDVISLTHEGQDTPTETKTKGLTNFNLKKYTTKRNLSILVIISIILTISLIFLIPRAQTVRYSSKTRESLSESFTKLDSVDSSLNSLFRFVTQSEGDVKLSDSSTIDKNSSKDAEIGKRLETLLTDLENVFNKLEISKRGSVSFGNKVKGFTTPADDPNKVYRDQRDLASEIGISVDDTKTSFKTFESQLDGSLPKPVTDFSEKLLGLKSNVNNYLAESTKTSNYYVTISDLSIKLEGNFDVFQLSLNSATDINSLVASFEEVSASLEELKSRLEGLDQDKLPDEISDLHQDSVELFDVVIKYFENLKTLTLIGNEKKIVDLTINTAVKLNQLTISGANHELSFWKNNKTLNSYDSLSEDHTEVLKILEETHDSNNFFIFRFIGVR